MSTVSSFHLSIGDAPRDVVRAAAKGVLAKLLKSRPKGGWDGGAWAERVAEAVLTVATEAAKDGLFATGGEGQDYVAPEELLGMLEPFVVSVLRDAPRARFVLGWESEADEDGKAGYYTRAVVPVEEGGPRDTGWEEHRLTARIEDLLFGGDDGYEDDDGRPRKKRKAALPESCHLRAAHVLKVDTRSLRKRPDVRSPLARAVVDALGAPSGELWPAFSAYNLGEVPLAAVAKELSGLGVELAMFVQREAATAELVRLGKRKPRVSPLPFGIVWTPAVALATSALPNAPVTERPARKRSRTRAGVSPLASEVLSALPGLSPVGLRRDPLVARLAKLPIDARRDLVLALADVELSDRMMVDTLLVTLLEFDDVVANVADARVLLAAMPALPPSGVIGQLERFRARAKPGDLLELAGAPELIALASAAQPFQRPEDAEPRAAKLLAAIEGGLPLATDAWGRKARAVLDALVPRIGEAWRSTLTRLDDARPGYAFDPADALAGLARAPGGLAARAAEARTMLTLFADLVGAGELAPPARPVKHDVDSLARNLHAVEMLTHFADVDPAHASEWRATLTGVLAAALSELETGGVLAPRLAYRTIDALRSLGGKPVVPARFVTLNAYARAKR